MGGPSPRQLEALRERKLYDRIAIERQRAFRAALPTESWWIGLSWQAFSDRIIHCEAFRMRNSFEGQRHLEKMRDDW